MLMHKRMSQEAFNQLYRLDESFIGTASYMGLAYFWNHEYRHWLRDATEAVRRRVHRRFLEAGLDVDGESAQHLAIVNPTIHPPAAAQRVTK